MPSTPTSQFDVIIIGSGPGGYVDGYPRQPNWGLKRRLLEKEALGRGVSQLGMYSDQSFTALC